MHRASGGVAILIKRNKCNGNEDNWKIEEIKSDFNSNIWVKITLDQNCELLINGLYLPPEKSNYAENNHKILEDAENKFNSIDDGSIKIMLGDMNARFGNIPVETA